ncbi:hypothetical protein L596_001367 [Steinernema carpocapsae]|uniref:Uncharacterized protein n=1 Tax=Steinernema carpocapsae TaxID=34508 RepID=A0A4U8UKU6_STECR|nr:hypothetical protein L596_001367 [Steinernema carpocapsae]
MLTSCSQNARFWCRRAGSGGRCAVFGQNSLDGDCHPLTKKKSSFLLRKNDRFDRRSAASIDCFLLALPCVYSSCCASSFGAGDVAVLPVITRSKFKREFYVFFTTRSHTYTQSTVNSFFLRFWCFSKRPLFVGLNKRTRWRGEAYNGLNATDKAPADPS